MTALAFEAADDPTLCALIAGAKRRLALIAPAVTMAVAEAIIGRLAQLPDGALSVVLDADGEVYRLGYGDDAALERLRAALTGRGDALLMQPGVRIGVIAADDELLVFAPTPRLIEAGSTTAQKPNAIRLGGGSAAAAVVQAVGASVGTAALTPADVAQVAADLKANPPTPYALMERVRVLSSKVRYVELEFDGVRFATRSIPFPDELMGVADDNLRRRMGTRITPFADLGPVAVKLTIDGKESSQKIDDRWFSKARADLERRFTYEVPNYGRVILREREAEFRAAAEELRSNLDRYRQAVQAALAKPRKDFCARIVKEFGRRWTAKPPERLRKWNLSRDELIAELQQVAEAMAEAAVTFDEPTMAMLPKGIAPETVGDGKFVPLLKEAMRKAGVPAAKMRNLFEEYDAVRSSAPQGESA